jgi:chromosome partitioning protein
MIKLVILNQRGGVGKTTSALVIARYFADAGKKTLLVDADPQGSINTILRLKAEKHLHDFLIKQYALEDCVVSPFEKLDILCGNRATADAEKLMMNEMARERLFENFFGRYDDRYDAIVIDVGPSVSLMQTCAMVYAEKVLVPVNTDLVSVSGAAACLQFCETLAKAVRIKVEPIALLPTMIDRRIGMTRIVRGLLEELSTRYKVPILHEIRTDTAIGKATRAKQFLVDLDPRTKAMQDYDIACGQLLGLFEGKPINLEEHIKHVEAEAVEIP